MTTGEIASIAFGCLGMGGAVVSLYIRGTIAETIIGRLNGRYQGSKVCIEKHTSLTAQMARIEHFSEKLSETMQDGFDSLRGQLIQAQTARKEIERGEIIRESKRTPSV
jgi:hypothetical protein